MKATTLSKVKKGDFFTLIPIEQPIESQVYVRGEYYRDCNRYSCSKFTDVCSERLFKRDKVVYVDFEF